jgi:hypothetical protein
LGFRREDPSGQHTFQGQHWQHTRPQRNCSLQICSITETSDRLSRPEKETAFQLEGEEFQLQRLIEERLRIEFGEDEEEEEMNLLSKFFKVWSSGIFSDILRNLRTY